jgi:serine/threonine protein kinase/Tol biopolymer transport system component
MADLTGQQLGNYRLVRLVGRGGFAHVYLGGHLHLHTRAAIKVLDAQLGSADAQDFLHEARTIARFQHPHIVQVLEFGVEGTQPFLVMDYAPHGTLRARYPKGTRLALETILPSIQQIAEALDYAHEQQVIHRDVKPENLLLGEHEAVLLSDFGIATLAQSSHLQGSGVVNIAGTIAYMAPEQIKGKPHPASDQYALAVVAYEWLTGEHPFQGTAIEVASQQLLADPPRLCAKAPTLSPAIEGVVLTALAKDPKDRFKSVGAFARALSEASHAEPPVTAARSLTMLSLAAPDLAPTLAPESEPEEPGHGASTPRRFSRRAVLAAGMAGAAVLGVGSGVAWLTRRQPALNASRPAATPAPSPTQPPPATDVNGVWTFRYSGFTPAAVTWAPDGSRLAAGLFVDYSNTSTWLVAVWNPTTGARILTYPAWAPAGEWAPVGDFIVWGTEVYVASTGKWLASHQDQASLDAVHWSPDGTRIAAGYGDQTVQIWDPRTGTTLFTYRGHQASVTSLAWSADGRRIISGDVSNRILVWDVVTGSTIFTFRAQGPFLAQGPISVGWSPDGSHFAFTDEPGSMPVRIFDATTGKQVSSIPGTTTLFAWSPDGQRIACLNEYGSVIVIYDVSSSVGRSLKVYVGHTQQVFALAWSPDGTRLASASQDTTVQVWPTS